MKKLLILLSIMMLLFSSSFSIINSSGNKQNFIKKIETVILDDELDQQSTKTDALYAIGASDRELAQSFTPTLPLLTRVFLRLKSTGNADFLKYYVDIKSSYLGSALTSAYIDRSELIIGTGYYEFDFPDISVTTGSQYFIILRGVSDSGDTSKVYWWYGYPDPYAGGDAWYESISGWNYLQEGIDRCDFVFQTYGSEENNPPYHPSQPSGPTTGLVGESYIYTTYTIDPDDDDIQYGWDWDGDNIVDEYSDLISSGNVDSRSHSWDYPGTYNVKVKAKDEHGALSGFSSYLSVIISGENNPPDKPNTPSGPNTGNPGTEYDYSTSTTDPENDDVYYLWDWGNELSEWDGPYESGNTVSMSHIWDVKGEYSVKVKSKDEFGEDSDWSDPIIVSMPKIKSNNDYNSLLIRLIQRFPILEFLL